MGTNYYFKLKQIHNNLTMPSCSTNLKEKLQIIVDDFIQQISLIHIGKRSGGWKPLFQQTEYFQSVEDIITFYNENKDCLLIVDEYDRELTFEELKEQLIDWNKDNTEAKGHYGEWCWYTDNEGYDFSKVEFG